MQSTRYLIIGGGMTGDAAVKGIREHDADGSIVLVGAEQHPPYARPPLTKSLWSGSDEAKIWRGTEDAGADLRLGRRIVSLDLDGRRATDDAGEEYAWEKVLLATGGSPRTIPGTRRRRLLPDARRLPDGAGPRARGLERRRDRRGLHRLGDRGRPGHERLSRDDGVPGGGRSRPASCRRSSPPSSRRSTAGTASRC